MKKLKAVIIVFVLFSLFGFKGQKPLLFKEKKQEKSIPTDFNFVINSGGNDSYNSKYNSFYRKYLEGEKTIKLKLTKEEKENIYSFRMKIAFFKMQVKFQPKGGIIVITNPSFSERITVYINGKNKSVVYDTGYTNDLNDKKAKSFLELYEMIWGILYKKKEIIELPESNFYYE